MNVIGERTLYGKHWNSVSLCCKRFEGSITVENAPPKQEPLTSVRGFFVASSTTPRQSGTVQDSNSNEQRQGITIAVVSCLFALHPPILCVSAQSLRASVHGRYARRKKGKFLHIGSVLSAGGMVYSAQQIGICKGAQR